MKKFCPARLKAVHAKVADEAGGRTSASRKCAAARRVAVDRHGAAPRRHRTGDQRPATREEGSSRSGTEESERSPTPANLRRDMK